VTDAPSVLRPPVPDDAPDEVLDLAFDLVGVRLPRDDHAALWAALLDRLPWLAGEPAAGVHAIRGPVTDAGLLLSRRARLTLRLPAARRGDAARLSGQSLLVEGERVELGAVRERPLEPYPTLSAQFVATGAPDELGHQEAVQAMLEALGLPLRFICGRMRAVRAGESAVSGGGVVLHQLRPEQSLMVQQRGLGELRGLGCGLFLPHKIISGID
jgi:CRISPR-associated protein Cas6